MIQNYFRTAWRNLRKDKVYTAINIIGLAIGICTSWIIFSITDYEFNYDKEQPDGNRVYQIVYNAEGEDGERRLAGVSKAILPLLERNVPSVELAVPLILKSYYHGQADRSNAIPIYDPEKQVETNESYFRLVPYKWLAGDPETALDAPGKVVLTASRAKEYFPGMSPTEVHGQTITYNDSLAFQVSGIVADLVYPNSFVWQEMFHMPVAETHTSDWERISTANLLYVKLQDNVKPTALIKHINQTYHQHNSEQFEKNQLTSWYSVLPLEKLHFANDVQNMPHRTVNKRILYGLIGIAVFLILLASINYVNLTTARIPGQSKNIGIRKALGIRQEQLIAAFVIETLLVIVIAAVLSVALSFALQDILKDIVPAGIHLFDRFGTKLAFLAALIIVVTSLSSLYPSWVTWRVRTIETLRNKIGISPSQSGINIRKSLIVFQFVIAIVFTTCTIIIGLQLHYTTNKNLGFDHKAVVTVELPLTLNISPENYGKMFVLKQELQKHHAINVVALGDLPMNTYLPSVKFNMRGQKDPTEHRAGVKFIDSDYIHFYGMNLLAGENIVDSDTANAYLITDSFRKSLGFASPEEAIGYMLLNDFDKRTLPIAGVLEDFHQLDLRNKIDAAVMMPTNYRMNVANIRLQSAKPSEWKEAIELIEKEWKALYPAVPFKYQFYDSMIEDMYSQEQLVGKMVSIAMGTTILISCLGLFGLATLTAFQRTKEIGIRKVLGASVSGIVALLSKDFVKLVLIAITIASPFAWWAMNRWLEDFAYRIDIEWWMFGLAGLAAVVIALLTVSWQAIRAAVANPVDSLRDE